jgi:predicted nucleic acid-binding protein
VGVDAAIARRAAGQGCTWRRSHQGIATAELIIAATVEELRLELATLNVRHFPTFEGLQPPYGT